MREHDEWSAMGKENLGESNIRWGEMVGWDILCKSIINDHWADAPKESWTAKHVDYVMSKLYYVWVRQMWDKYPEEDE